MEVIKVTFLILFPKLDVLLKRKNFKVFFYHQYYEYEFFYNRGMDTIGSIILQYSNYHSTDLGLGSSSPRNLYSNYQVLVLVVRCSNERITVSDCRNPALITHFTSYMFFDFLIKQWSRMTHKKGMPNAIADAKSMACHASLANKMEIGNGKYASVFGT